MSPQSYQGSAPSKRDIDSRYRRILWFAGRYLLITWWHELVLPRIGLAKVAERTRSSRMQQLAQRFHTLAIELGGLMIKVGQFMSSRLDVLPPEITAELAGLQDEVPPVPFAEIRLLAEAELGVSLDRAFDDVDEIPLAAASFGQAHRARLSDFDAEYTGLRNVVIKVQRPGIDEIIDVDLAALRRVGGWLKRVRIVSNRVDMPHLIEEFATTSFQEIDYMHEAANAERFAENFAGNDRVSAPAVVWERTSKRVLTLEDVTAIKITDTDALLAAGIDPADVARALATVMFDQLFLHGFFHADPHPGNIFVTPDENLAEGADSKRQLWKLTFIDFGMMGEVTDDTREGLRKVLISVASRDGESLVEAIGKVGVLLPGAETAVLAQAMTQLFSRFGGMGLSQLREVDPREFRDFGKQFGAVIRSLPFQLPENFMLIIRTTSITSGVCSALNPRFNLWDSVEPYAAQLVRGEARNTIQDFAKQAVGSAGIVWGLPKRLDVLLAQVEAGSLTVSSPHLERKIDRLERLIHRVLVAVLFGSLLVAGVIARASDPVFGTVLVVASSIPLLYALFSGRRR